MTTIVVNGRVYYTRAKHMGLIKPSNHSLILLEPGLKVVRVFSFNIEI